jgi:retinol dehydrogenase 12
MHQGGRRVSVVTGGSGGIGRWIALGLARAGQHVVLVCRDPARGRAAVDWIARQIPCPSLELRLSDLGSLRATRRLGVEISAEHPRLGLLVNNAGMFTARRQSTAEGREATLAVNHLAPFVLTDVLESALRAGAPSRIVNVGSSQSDWAEINPDDLELARGWGMVRAYSRSKLAMMIATFARAERLRGTGVVAHVAHPGAVATSLVRESGAIGIAVADGTLPADRGARRRHAAPCCLSPGLGDGHRRLCQRSHGGGAKSARTRSGAGGKGRCRDAGPDRGSDRFREA